ncbi:Chromatin structure remodeling complex protein sfh1 [Malassezia cuniculi]|uniref:Chromatin structure remodeling complex protein sfh1 n=1 Tax=Malassezia cuniculi TaxID=948313 RepID=A0AAF0EU23_9BASI|nr:Chromatin structure remodeling complex protein sfh1 [Malassezia cuniculi]
MDTYRRATRSLTGPSPVPSANVGGNMQAPGNTQRASQGEPWLLGVRNVPYPPQRPIAPSQALYTTYASRMRAGTTTLVQPIVRDLGEYETKERNTNSGGRNTRYSNAVFYGEDEDEDDYEPESSDDDYASEPQQRGHMTSGPDNSSQQTSNPDIKTPADMEALAEKMPPGSQLGLPVPENRTVVRPVKRTRHEYFAETQLEQQAASVEVLVPIRIEFNTDTHRIKDVFMWNINERLTTPFQFAQIFLHDLDLPEDPYAQQIENQILQQLSDAMSVLDADVESDSLSRLIDLKSSARERKRVESAAEEHRRRLAASVAAAGRVDPNVPPAPRKRGRPRKYPLPGTERPPPVQTPLLQSIETPQAFPSLAAPPSWETPVSRSDEPAQSSSQPPDALSNIDAEDDLRVIVEYEVQVLRHVLRDRLEWDLASPLTPEEFARSLARDMGLPLEGCALVAHAVREQLLNHRRAALELGLFGTGKIFKCASDELALVFQEEQQMQLENPGEPMAEDTLDELRDEMEPPTTRSRRTGGDSNNNNNNAPNSFALPDKSQPLFVRKQQALATLRDLLALGPRPLEGVWRDFHEAHEFGPLLEYLSEADLEKMEEAELRASRYVFTANLHRRSRRDVQRVMGRRR